MRKKYAIVLFWVIVFRMSCSSLYKNDPRHSRYEIPDGSLFERTVKKSDLNILNSGGSIVMTSNDLPYSSDTRLDLFHVFTDAYLVHCYSYRISIYELIPTWCYKSSLSPARLWTQILNKPILRIHVYGCRRAYGPYFRKISGKKNLIVFGGPFASRLLREFDLQDPSVSLSRSRRRRRRRRRDTPPNSVEEPTDEKKKDEAKKDEKVEEKTQVSDDVKEGSKKVEETEERGKTENTAEKGEETKVKDDQKEEEATKMSAEDERKGEKDEKGEEKKTKVESVKESEKDEQKGEVDEEKKSVEMVEGRQEDDKEVLTRIQTLFVKNGDGIVDSILTELKKRILESKFTEKWKNVAKKIKENGNDEEKAITEMKTKILESLDCPSFKLEIKGIVLELGRKLKI